MKVTTDGVLLGAWADVSGAKTILDIGTGTGVIALMLAQKNSEAVINAIDIEENACQQARDNFEQSQWSRRLNAIHTSLQDLAVAPLSFGEGLGERCYDVIISNPPYFVDDYKTENHQRNVARHSVALSYKELLKGINRLLKTTGKAFLVIPAFNFQLLETIAGEENLFVTKHAGVIAVKGKNPYLALLELERLPVPRFITVARVFKETIVIQDEEGNFTEQYKELTKEFYLKF